MVGAGYFATMGIPMRRGRDFELRKDTGATLIVNEEMARQLYPEQDPLGQQVEVDGGPAQGTRKYEVIGVVRNSKYDSIRRRARPTFFLAFSQDPGFMGSMGSMGFEVRTISDPAPVMASVRRAVADVDGRVPVMELHTEEESIDGRLKRERLFAQLSTALGLLALVLVI